MGFGNPVAERRALEMTYEDTAVISREKDLLDGDLTMTEPEPIYSGVPCALSRDRGGADSSGQRTPQNEIDYDATLFLAPELDVQPGDQVEVSRFGRAYVYAVVGRPAVYATHQEARLKGSGLV
jgi:hypothetical protein